VLWQRMTTNAARRTATLPRWNDTVRQFWQVLAEVVRANPR
jgi:hypothetical protein